MIDATVTSVYDGDTITTDTHYRNEIQIGRQRLVRHDTLEGVKVRLYGINTPEVRGPEREHGLFVRDQLRELILGQDVKLELMGRLEGKFGRWLANVWLGELLVNQWLVDGELAEINFY